MHAIKHADLATLAGQKARIYRNLHNGLFSVQIAGRVVAHVASISLDCVTFTVQPAGRAKVLATRKKTVHAFVNGIVRADIAPAVDRASYNPFKSDSFTDAHGFKLFEAVTATLRNGSVFYI